jgi:hypothetical protein
VSTSKQGKKAVGGCLAFFWLLAIILILGGAFYLVFNGTDRVIDEPPRPPPTFHRITETQDISYAGFKRITVRVLVRKDSTKASAKRVAEYIVKKKRSEIRGLKGITIWGYYEMPATSAWEAFMAEWELGKGLYFFTFRKPS